MANISPYTIAISDCLNSISKDATGSILDDAQKMQLMINMLQGRMLEHIKQRVSKYYNIEPSDLNEEFSEITLNKYYSEEDKYILLIERLNKMKPDILINENN